MKYFLLFLFALLPSFAFSQSDAAALKTLQALSDKSVSFYRQGQTDSANACFEKIAVIYNSLANKQEAIRIVYLPFSIYLYSKSISAKANIMGLSRYTWRDVQKNLSDSDIAIEFIDAPTPRGRFYSAATLCKDDTLPKVTGLFYETQTEKIADIWTKLSPRLTGKKNIYFAPIDILHWMPIEYSPDVDTFRVYRLTTTRELVNGDRSKREFKSAVLFGGIDYGSYDKASSDTARSAKYRGLRYGGPLPYSKDEVDSIGNILHSHRIPYRIVSGKAATETSFKTLSGRAPSILHIATHGFWWNVDKTRKFIRGSASDPSSPSAFSSSSDNSSASALSEEDSILSQSGLLLAGANNTLCGAVASSDNDGILTSREISKMDLHGVDLVVLSGCDTGTGAPMWGEGIYGLQRAFKKAGVNTILMSTNKVDDHATQILMTSFYRHLLAGESKREALIHAQTDVYNYAGGIYKDPKYWLNFILIDAL